MVRFKGYICKWEILVEFNLVVERVDCQIINI